MPGRTLLLLAIIVLAIAVPYLVMDDQRNPSTDKMTVTDTAKTKLTALWQKWGRGWSQDEPRQANSDLSAAEALLAQNQQLLNGYSVSSRELAGLPGVSLADALRFDVTPAWVTATWPRVTPQRLETGWYGVRVPLVTGTEPDDVAGSLTYYFNGNNFVERIQLYAYTGDAEPLTSLVQQQYGLRAYAAVGRGLFLSFYETVPIGILKIEDAPVQSLDDDRARYRVQLELNLPRPGATLSEDVMDKLRKLREAKMI